MYVPAHFAETVANLKRHDPEVIIEVLTPDFLGNRVWIEKIVKAGPDVFAHNIETVERLTPKVRDPRAKQVKAEDLIDRRFLDELEKSGFMAKLWSDR